MSGFTSHNLLLFTISLYIFNHVFLKRFTVCKVVSQISSQIQKIYLFSWILDKNILSLQIKK